MIPANLRYQVRKKLYGDSLVDFLAAAWGVVDPERFNYGKHLAVIAAALTDVSLGKCRRLLINIPPRFCKSTLTSVVWPAWDWINNPSRQFFTLSHQETLAIRDSRKMRALVESDWYQSYWPIAMADDQNEKKTFINEALGNRQCAGLDAGFTGKGGDIIIIDDPIDRDQAESKGELERVNAQFDEKVQGRLNNAETGAIVIIGQRMATNELFGHLMRRGGWDVLCLPLEYEKDHPVKTTVAVGDWRTEDGELLWPERISRATVDGIKRSMSSHAYAGQHQQRPTAREGGMFKRGWWKIITRMPGPATRAVRYWDMASTEKSTADWTAGVLVALVENQYVVVDVRRAQCNPTARIKLMEETAIIDAARWPNVRVELWEEQEGGASGVEVAQSHVMHFAQWGLNVERPTGSKETRASLGVPLVENGLFSVLMGEWTDRFLDEICAFPHGENDDQVDGWSGCVAKFAGKKKWAIAG